MPVHGVEREDAAHATQIASVTSKPFLEGGLDIIDCPIDASPEPLNSATQVKLIQPMFNAPVQPLTSHQPHGVVSGPKNLIQIVAP